MLLVRLDDHTPRARFAVNHLLGRMTGWPVHVAASEEEFRSSELPKMRYGSAATDSADVLTVHASGALGLHHALPAEPEVGSEEGLPVLYPSSAGDDPFAGAFYLLARCEEWAPRVLDAHGRLPSAEHFVVRHGMEQLPVIDHWVMRLAKVLRKRHPGLPAPQARYRHVLSVDVDNGLMVRGRPSWKQAGALMRAVLQGKVGEAALRMQVLLGRRNDPFDRYADLVELARTGKVDRLIAFLLMRGEGAHDHAADPRHPMMNERIKQMNGAFDIGLHPSYRSSEDPQVFREDRALLEQITGHPVRISRQHFLRWQVPGSLRLLEASRLIEDHTLGFSDRPGFRCGTCTPFPWYDLEQERETDLMLWPFAVMDSTLHDRMGLGPEEAMRTMCAVSDSVRAVNGTFVSVWHDRFLSGYGMWKGWPEAMQQVVEHARS
jgi:hypothetical protein